MAITSFLFFRSAARNWGWSLGAALALYIPLIVDRLLVLLGERRQDRATAAGSRSRSASAMFAIMTTWWRGRHELSKMMEAGTMPDELFLADIAETPLPRVRGTAVFMSSGTDGMPNVLLHHVKHNKVLHKQVVLLSIVTENVPFVDRQQVARPCASSATASTACIARVGFMQQPNVPKILARCEKHGLVVDATPTRRTTSAARRCSPAASRALARWRKMLFSFLARNARPPTAFFHLPPNRVVELGLQIEL